ncbi:MAG: hypothetical protein JWP94_3748 [Mucilaginibacter sp.]|nr:hypothetical protein [Mucilaginibacter sp.]
MGTTFGVMVYEILPDGCLNGVGSDTHDRTNDKIFNEVARKENGLTEKTIEGDYTCSYMNLDGKFIVANLKITKPEKSEGRFEFNWIEAGKQTYKGIGWKTKENQVIVYYEYLNPN